MTFFKTIGKIAKNILTFSQNQIKKIGHYLKRKKTTSKKVVEKTKTKNKTSLKHSFHEGLKKIKRIQFGSLTLKEQILFSKRLSFLSRAGVPILESIEIIKDQAKSKRYKNVITAVLESISNGQSLSKSLRKFQNIFGDFAINIIEVGETTGVLSENLEYLSNELRNRNALKKKIIGAFVYPAVVSVATIGITGFLMIYLFPKITPVFASLHANLPLSTRALIYISNLAQTQGWHIMLALLVILILFVISFKKIEKFHFLCDYALLRSPVVGTMFINYNTSNITRTLGLLIKSGLPLSEALPVTSRTCENLVYKSELLKLGQTVNRGEKLSSYLKTRSVLFPDTLTQIVAVGEKSGRLSDSLIYISELFASEVDEFTKNLGTLVEPVLMIVMGLFVGFIAISIITPIYGITQNLHPN